MRRFSLLSLMAVTALSLYLVGCDDKKQEEQAQQRSEKSGPLLLRQAMGKKKKEEEETKKSRPQKPVDPIELKFGEATAFATAKGASTGAVFLRISNPNPRADNLNSVTATVGTAAELHKTTIDENGTATMRKVRQFAIKSKNHLVLNPAGYHIMILGLTKPLLEGDTFEVTLDFENAKDATIPVKVIAPSADAHVHHPAQKMMSPPGALRETIKKLQTPEQSAVPATTEHQHEHPAQ